MPKISTRDSMLMREHCIDRSDFQTHGALSGRKGGPVTLGNLPYEYWWSADHAEYVVYYYTTPVAWYGPDGWTFPDEKYSTTTSRHQGRLSFINQWLDK
jgi:hypothetical protein